MEDMKDREELIGLLGGGDVADAKAALEGDVAALVRLLRAQRAKVLFDLDSAMKIHRVLSRKEDR